MSEYWADVVEEALEDAGVKATKDQVSTIVYWIEGSHENFGMAHGHDAILNPLQTENDDLRRKLKYSQNKADEVSGLERDVSNLEYSVATKQRRIYYLEERIEKGLPQ